MKLRFLIQTGQLTANHIEQHSDLASILIRWIGLKIGFQRINRLTQKVGLHAKHSEVAQLGRFIPAESDKPSLDGKNGRNVLSIPVNRFEVLEHPRRPRPRSNRAP